MPDQWYYTSQGQELGPVSSGELKQLAASGVLKPDDQVWKEGLAEWRPARNVRGLFPEFPHATATAVSPPPNPLPTSPIPSNDIAATASAFGQALLATGKKKLQNVANSLNQPLTQESEAKPVQVDPPFVPVVPMPASSGAKTVGKFAVGAGAIIAGMGCLGMIVLCGTCGIVGTLVPTGEKSETHEILSDQSSLPAAFKVYPPQIKTSISDGKEVWLLEGAAHFFGDEKSPLPSRTYIVFTDGNFDFYQRVSWNPVLDSKLTIEKPVRAGTTTDAELLKIKVEATSTVTCEQNADSIVLVDRFGQKARRPVPSVKVQLTWIVDKRAMTYELKTEPKDFTAHRGSVKRLVGP